MAKFGNRDEKEMSRELSEAEQKRLDRFEEMSVELIQKGFKRAELTISIVKANIFALVLLIPLAVIGIVLFNLKNRDVDLHFNFSTILLYAAAYFILIAVHELIHGVSWAVFTPHHFKDIEFGFMKQYLTPYCTCSVPLTKGKYIFGAVMPLILLGVVPMVVGILAGSPLLLLLGIVLADGAGGDILIIWNVLRYRTDAQEVVYMDHPTQAGVVVFER